MRKAIFIYFSLIFVFCQNAKAQPFVDVVNLQCNYFPKTQYIGNSNNQNSLILTNGSLFLPLKLNPKNIFVVGLDFNRTGFNYSGDTTINTVLGTTSFQVGLVKQFSSKFKAMMVAVPKIATDFKDIDNRDFQMGGALLLTYIKKNSLKFKLGLYYNREFFGNYFMPLVGIDWKINSNAYLFGLLPGTMNFEYKLLDKKLYTGISYKSITASYRLNDKLGKYYVRQGDPFWGDDQLKGFLHCYITKQIMVFGEIGYALHHYYQQYNDNKEKETTLPVYSKMKDQLFFGGGLAFRIRLDDDYLNR
ncbi:MAG: hypothetical protein HXX09_12935 [Bacteroidetes bacterium]|nr:hypothetical protein [Bacteroidota bacterium]